MLHFVHLLLGATNQRVILKAQTIFAETSSQTHDRGETGWQAAI